MPKETRSPRLGLFLDAPFRLAGRDGAPRVCGGEELFGFATFAEAVGECLGGLTLISRATEDPERASYPMGPGTSLAPLPDYPSARNLGAVVAVLPGILAGLWRSLSAVDILWISATHPFGLILAMFAAIRRRPIAILVRQDSMAYFRARLEGRRWLPVLAVLFFLDRAYRLLGRALPTTAVGGEAARQYGAPRSNVLTFYVNLTCAEDIPEQPPERPWNGVKLLTVGRLEPEKNPLLLVDALAELERSSPGGYSATWVGTGRMAEHVARRAVELGVSGRVELAGFVPAGPELDRRLREADCFVHVSITEGVPGVITEAMSRGLPVVATDVGGVREATGDGAGAMLVPPNDAEAIASAVRKLESDRSLREGLACRGLELARQSAIDVQSERVASFLRERC